MLASRDSVNGLYGGERCAHIIQMEVVCLESGFVAFRPPISTVLDYSRSFPVAGRITHGSSTTRPANLAASQRSSLSLFTLTRITAEIQQ